jgi:hypothetical protein
LVGAGFTVVVVTDLVTGAGAGAIGWAVLFFFFVLIILYSLYLEYDSLLIPSASGLAG